MLLCPSIEVFDFSIHLFLSHRFLDLLEGSNVYPCLLSEDNKVLSLPPVTNSDITKVCNIRGLDSLVINFHENK